MNNKREATFLTSDNPRVPRSPFPFRHSTPLQMRFGDIDMLGHLNNNIYMAFMDLGKSRYFADVLGEKLNWHKVGVVIVHIDCDFYAPTYFTEKIEVWSTLTHIGDKSLRMEQRVVNADTHEVKCIGRTVLSGFDADTARSIPIAREWVDAFERYEERTMTD